MANIKVLVVDDEFSIRQMIVMSLQSNGYDVVEAEDANSAKAMIVDDRPDLVLLDWMMPGMSGLDFARWLRKNDLTADLPIIMLTAKGDVADKVVGLELGADDYLSKPFEPAELLARVQSILRRTSSSDESLIDNIEFEGLSVDKIKQIVKVDGEPINLSTAELEALFLFVNNANKPLSRDFLVENLRGIQWQTCDRSVDVLVSRLRNKLGESPVKTRFIKTVH